MVSGVSCRGAQRCARNVNTRSRLILACAFLAFLTAGCATPKGVGGYFKDRGRDFGESFRLSAGPGIGIHARVNAIIFFAGEGFARAHKYGWDGAAGIPEAHWDMLAMTVWVPILFDYDSDVRNLDEGTPWRYFLKPHFEDPVPSSLPADVAYLSGHIVLTGYNWLHNRRDLGRGTLIADRSWLEAEATAAVVSVRAGVNLAELLDFILGIGCLDILGDDRHVNREESSPGPSEKVMAHGE